jgi:Tfp pilus assembly protein PilO
MNLRSVPVTRFLGVTALVVVLLAGWFLLVGPTVSRLGEVDQRLTDAQDRNSSMSLQLATLRAQAEELPATRQQAQSLAEVFPPTADQPGFFAQVTAAAAAAGIGADDITDITLGAPVVPEDAEADASGVSPADSLPTTPADPEIALQPVSVMVSGSYRDLTAMLGNLESMRRTLYVTGVDLAEESAEEGAVSETMTITVSGVTFVAPPLEAPDLNQQSGRSNDAGPTGTDQASG